MIHGRACCYWVVKCYSEQFYITKIRLTKRIRKSLLHLLLLFFPLGFFRVSKWFYFLLFLLWQAENGLRVVASPQRNQRCWRNGSCGRYVGEIRSPDYECLVGTGGWLMPVIRCTSLVLVLTEMSGYNVDKAKRGHWQHISNGVNSGFASLFQRKQTSGLVYKIDFV